MSPPPLITVFGASGAQGGSVARAILADPHRRFRVRAVTRAPGSFAARLLAEDGAEIVQAAREDAEAVQRAMDGAHGAFCVTGSCERISPERELAEARAMAECAARARVKHVIWSTLEDTRDYVRPGSGRLPLRLGRYNLPGFDAKSEANQYFIDGGVPTTLLYTSFTWDDLVEFAMPTRRQPDGRLGLVLPIGLAKLPGIAADDIGPCAVSIFARGEDLAGKSIGIAGEHLTGAQIAEQLALALGEPAVHADVSADEYRALGFHGAEDLASMFEFVREFEAPYCAARSVRCARELHPRLKTFAAWLSQRRAQILRAPSESVVLQ